MADILLKTSGIHKSFAGVHALKGVGLEIARGEIHCLAGENGCGKSTLIKIISGVYQQDAGSIEFDGRVLGRITPIDAILRGIQVIYQDFSVFPNLSVMENLAFNSELADKRRVVSWKRLRRIAREAVAKINFEVDLDSKVSSLSVAQKQMVAISRALMFNARLIIMDEPTTALTRKEVDALFKVILQLKAQGISILFVSHKLNEVFEISDRFTILRNGEMVKEGHTHELDAAKFTYYMTGREFAPGRFEALPQGDTPLLEVRDLCMRGAFEDVSFKLFRGEIVGITGLLDSGRSELALALFGIRRADSGSMLLKGEEQRMNNPRAAIRGRLGLVPEDRLNEGLFLPRSIADNLIIAEIDRLASRLGVMDRARREEEVARLVADFAIATPDPDNAAQTLSGGNQQRVVLAKWLACNLDVLVLSGPTVGVDIGSKHDIHAILRKLAGQGMGILLISDDLPEVIENCSRVLVLKNGKIAAEMVAAQVTEQRILSHMM